MNIFCIFSYKLDELVLGDNYFKDLYTVLPKSSVLFLSLKAKLMYYSCTIKGPQDTFVRLF